MDEETKGAINFYLLYVLVKVTMGRQKVMCLISIFLVAIDSASKTKKKSEF